MTPPILVTGGTGTLGRHVVRRLQDAGHEIRVLSRHGRSSEDGIEYVTADLLKGEGIEPAVDGAAIIAHCAGSAKGDDDATRNLVRAASRAGARHLVYISVIGADRIPVRSGLDREMFGYFAFKLAAERVVADSGLPWTTLRAAQFHDLLLMTAQQMAKVPVMPVPAGFRFQPVNADEVAARLVELTLGPPAGLVPDMGGPRVYAMADLLRGYLRACGKHRVMLPVWAPGQGRPRVPLRRKPGSRTGRGSAALGELPCGADGLAGRPQTRCAQHPLAGRAEAQPCPGSGRRPGILNSEASFAASMMSPAILILPLK